MSIQLINGLFKYHTRKLVFVLCVDDFVVKYNSHQYLQYLLTTLKKYCNISLDMEGPSCWCLTFDWHYQDNYVDEYMTNYVHKALKRRYNYPSPIKLQFVPHRLIQLVYGQKSNTNIQWNYINCWTKKTDILSNQLCSFL